MYLGRDNVYGLFEKQVITPVPLQVEYNLNWTAGSATSLLVVTSGQILNPGIDYNITLGGRTIAFSTVPAIGTYIIYLGRELSVPRTVGIEPALERFIGDGLETSFALTTGPVNGSSVIVFVNGVQKRLEDDFTLSGSTITFLPTSVPGVSADISVYIHGVERFDSILLNDLDIKTRHLDNLSVTNPKIAANAVTYDKIDLPWSLYTPTITSFHSMTIGSPSIHTAAYSRVTRNILKIKLDFSCIFTGVADNIIRFNLPPSGIDGLSIVDEICAGNITLYTDTIVESGIIRWGGANALDIQRANGINFTLGETWRIKLRTEIDLG